MSNTTIKSTQELADAGFDGRGEYVAKAFKDQKEFAGANKAFTKHKKDSEGNKVGKYNNVQTAIIRDLKEYVKEAELMRTGTDKKAPLDLSFGQFMGHRLGIATDDKGSMDNLLNFLGINPNNTTIQKLATMPEFPTEFKWLIPEVYRDAIRTGLERVPIFPNLISGDVPVSQPSVIMPEINRADTQIGKVNEMETIPMGSIAFKQKTVNIFKVGTGFEVSDEVRRYVSINILSEYLDHVGIILGMGLDTLAVDVLLNGDNEGTAGNSAPVIGVENIGQLDYDNDLARLAIRMSILGHQADQIVAGEDAMRQLLVIPEIKGFAGETTLATAGIQVKTPIVRNYNMLPSGVMPTAGKWLFVDPRKALIKLTAVGVMVESDRIVQNQSELTTVTTTTGFGKLLQDASILVDSSQAFSGFPTYMDSLQNNIIQF